jgi:outer membrane protein
MKPSPKNLTLPCLFIALTSVWGQPSPAPSAVKPIATPAAAGSIVVDPAPLASNPVAKKLDWFTRPYRARSVAPIRLANSSRLETLMRAGNLYLTSQDVVALAIENNIDIEIQRYGPLLAREILRRAQAGGALRSAGLGIAAAPQSVSLQGVSTATSTLTAGGAGVGSGGGIVTQLGPGIQSFDPTLSGFANFQHATTPQSNTVLTGTTAFVQDTRTFQTQYSQNFDFGMNASLGYSSTRVKVNSQFFALNPFTNGSLTLNVTQNLMQGFGRAVNTRNIRVQNNNVKVSELQFRRQLITTVSAVLNLYWDLVAFAEDVSARRQGVTAARQFLDETKRRVDLGALAEIEITRAESQFYASQQDLVISETNFMQQEMVLKNALSRTGVASGGLTALHIVPLDKFTMPPTDEVRPVEDLVQQALGKRVEIEQSRINLQSNDINLKGIKSGLKPTLQAFAGLTNNGLSGELTAAGAANPGLLYLAGGYGNLLAQIARRNYPNYSAGFSLNVPLRNRAAQSDYATSMLELRQNELDLKKNESQVRLDIHNAVIGLQQARARYEAAVKSRVLQEQTLDADRRKYELGASTPYQVVQDQRDLANARSSEVQAMANYTHARISMEQALGVTLDANNVSVSEAMTGRVARPSSVPDNAPASATRPGGGAQ